MLRPQGRSSVLLLEREPSHDLLRDLLGGEPELLSVESPWIYANRDAVICELTPNHIAARVLGEVACSIDGLVRGTVVLVELLH